MNLRNKALHGLTWSAIQNTGTQVISFVVFLVLARLLDPESFGLIALAGVAIGFMALLANYGLGAAIVQRADLDPEHLDTAFWAELAAKVLIMLLAYLFASWIAKLYDQPLLEDIIRWLSIGFIIDALTSVQISILRRNMAFDVLAVRSLATAIIGGVVGIAMALAGYGVWSLVGRRLASSFASLLLLWWVSDWRPGLKFSIRHLKELFSFGVGMMGSRIVGYFSNRTDTLLIGYFLGPVMLGYYTIGFRLVKLLSELLGGTVNNVAWPMFSRLQNEPERVKKVFYLATQSVALVAFPVFFGLFVLAPEIVPTLFGEKWTTSIQIMQVLTFIGLINAISWMNYSVIVAMGRSGWYFFLQAAIAVFTVIGILVAVNFGIVAVAVALVVVGCLLIPVSLLMVRKLVDINLMTYMGKLMSVTVASTIMVLFILALQMTGFGFSGGLPQLLFIVVTGALVYFLAIWLISPTLVRSTLDIVRSMLSAKKQKAQE